MCATIIDLPFELLENILMKTNGITLIKCRVVCKTWREFVDTNESLWREICRKEYKYASKIAKRKCGNDLSWKNIYRNLKMWPKVVNCEKNIRKFYNFTTHDKNHALEIDNSLLVLRESKGMILYDMNTLKYMPVAIPEKSCLRIANCDIATVILTKTFLYLQRSITNKPNVMTEASFKADKFVLLESELYFCFNRDVFKCDLKEDDLTTRLILHCDYDIAEIEFSDGVLYLFTDCGKIVSMKGEKVSVKSINCPEEWVRSIKHIKALDDQNFICYSRNIFYIETDIHKHVSLDFPPITSLFFYGDIVLIGTKSGEILLYRLSNQKRSTKPVFEKIAKMPEGTFAVSLDVYEKITGPVIVASTFFDIILLEIIFFPMVIYNF